MTTTFPASPRVMKGAVVGVDLFNPLASIVIFQYNPDTLSRSLEPQFSDQGGDRTEALRLGGPPVETINAEIMIDAIDQLETNDPVGASQGIHPQLAAMEMLIYPKSAVTIANTVLLATGTMEVIPPVAPLTLFIYGAKRVVPVKLTSLSVTEEAHDPSLNPLRARAQLAMRVLSTSDLSITHPGYALFLAHQVVKEALALVGSVGNLAGALGADASIGIST